MKNRQLFAKGGLEVESIIDNLSKGEIIKIRKKFEEIKNGIRE